MPKEETLELSGHSLLPIREVAAQQPLLMCVTQNVRGSRLRAIGCSVDIDAISRVAGTASP